MGVPIHIGSHRRGLTSTNEEWPVAKQGSRTLCMGYSFRVLFMGTKIKPMEPLKMVNYWAVIQSG